MKRSVATINPMKESVALKNRRQIDAKSVLWNNRKSKIDVKIDVKIGAKSAPNRRQIDAKSTKSENRKHPNIIAVAVKQLDVTCLRSQ